jgi:glycine betaine/proline transport system substrate-binding protein
MRIAKSLLPLTLGLAGLLCASNLANAADMGAKDETIKLAVLEWTGANVSTHVAGNLLQKLGYKVEYVTAGNFPQFSGLADGSLHASVEVWMNNVGDIYPKALEAKQVEDLGLLKLAAKEGWVYPKYMEAICPGLPDASALTKPDCVKALSTPETAPNGRFLDYPADWGSRAATIIADNSMPLTAVAAGSEGALSAELNAAYAAKKPLIMMFWGPHDAIAGKEVGWVKMPPCKTQEYTHCILPPDVDKIVWSGFSKKWPAAYAFLKAFEMDADAQLNLMGEMSSKGVDVDKATKAWVESNEKVWGAWIAAAKS